MSALTTEQLWDRLAEKKLVAGEMPPAGEQHSPWFVRVMLGFAGWIGALFLLGFMGAALSFVMRSGTASLVTGIIVCAGAAVIFRLAQEKDFAVQFGLATSFAGQALFIFGLFETVHWRGGFGYVSVAVFEAVLAAVVANEIHRAATAFAAAVSLSLALWWYGVPSLAPAFITVAFAVIWLSEFSWADRGSVLRPVGYSLVLAALYCNGALLMHGYSWMPGRGISSPMLSRLSSWTGSLVAISVFLYTVYHLARREGFGIKDRPAQAALLAVTVIALTSFKAPGIAAGLVVVLLGYANANRVLTGLGLFSLIAYLSLYYYQLQTTLLVKSLSLIATGLVLLTARFALNRLWPVASREGEGHA
ncbi:MAG: DUF4401 domain-containing protein [Nitrospirota bacterium]|nr:DUF4401 domain-containing protein [Nitrospirota bacterium]